MKIKKADIERIEEIADDNAYKRGFIGCSWHGECHRLNDGEVVLTKEQANHVFEILKLVKKHAEEADFEPTEKSLELLKLLDG